MSFRKFRTDNIKTHMQTVPVNKFVTLARDYIKQATDVNGMTGREAIGNLGRALNMRRPVLTDADQAKPFKTTKEVTDFDLLVDAALSKAINDYEPLEKGLAPLSMSTFATGKAVAARDDAGNLFTCTITISAGTWALVESYGAGMAISTIKGILSADPVLISPISTSLGKRCIKPEPYGWIFSTSSSVRLVDSKTARDTFPPPALNFDSVRNVK